MLGDQLIVLWQGCQGRVIRAVSGQCLVKGGIGNPDVPVVGVIGLGTPIVAHIRPRSIGVELHVGRRRGNIAIHMYIHQDFL